MLYFYFDHGWCVSREDDEIASGYETFDELLEWAVESGLLAA